MYRTCQLQKHQESQKHQMFFQRINMKFTLLSLFMVFTLSAISIRLGYLAGYQLGYTVGQIEGWQQKPIPNLYNQPSYPNQP